MLKLARGLQETHVRQRQFDSQLQFFRTQLQELHSLVAQQQTVIEWFFHGSKVPSLSESEQMASEYVELRTQANNVLENRQVDSDCILPKPQAGGEPRTEDNFQLVDSQRKSCVRKKTGVFEDEHIELKDAAESFLGDNHTGCMQFE